METFEDRLKILETSNRIMHLLKDTDDSNLTEVKKQEELAKVEHKGHKYKLAMMNAEIWVRIMRTLQECKRIEENNTSTNKN